MPHYKTIRLLGVSKLHVYQGRPEPNRNAYEPQDDTSSDDALLIKEMEETNHWARLGAQLYFGWFAVVLAFNGLATGWLFTHDGTLPRFARMIFLIFIGLNLIGTIVAYFIRQYMLDCDRRIKEVIWSLTQHQEVDDPHFRPQSPMPRQAIHTVFVFTGVTLFMLLLFWVTLVLSV